MFFHNTCLKPLDGAKFAATDLAGCPGARQNGARVLQLTTRERCRGAGKSVECVAAARVRVDSARSVD